MRYLPHTESETKEMLSVVGAKDVESLFSTIPEHLRFKGLLKLPQPLSEPELLSHLKTTAGKNNTSAISFLGAGAYRHYVPSAVTSLVGRSEFITPYTPYQPEISQGTLQAVFEYQTMIARLFEMDVVNASHYDGATSTAEAALLAMRHTKRKRVLAADTLHPEYRATINTLLAPSNAELVLVRHAKNGTVDREHLKELVKDSAGLIVQYPNFFGVIDELKEISDIVHNAGGLFITTVTEPISMGLIEAPGLIGADILCAEGQAFGCGLNFGGPYLGIFAAKEKFLRLMPGRIVGETVDADGRKGYVLTFATREQHIRREKATSNICSNEALCALTAAIYLSLLGKDGLTRLAELNYARAEYAKDLIKSHSSASGNPERAKEISASAGMTNIKLRFDGPTFNEFVVDVGRPASDMLTELAKKDIFGGVDLGRWYPEYKNCLLVSVTEENTKEEIDALVSSVLRIEVLTKIIPGD